MSRATEFIVADRLRIVGVVALALLVAALGAAEPLAAKFIFDELSGPQRPSMLAMGVGGLLVLEVARAILNGRLSITSWDVRIRVDYRLRERVIGRLGTLPLAFHRREGVGATMNRINQGIAGFLNIYSEVTLSIVPSLVFLLLSLTAMLRMDGRLCLVVLIFTPIPALIGAWAAREQAQRERTLIETWSKLYGRLNEVLAGILTVKGFARERAELDRFMATTRWGNEIVRAGVRRDTVTDGVRHFAATLARIAAMGYGGYLVIEGEVTVGTLVAFLGYIGGLFGPVQGLTNMYQVLRRGLVGLETIYAILDEPDTVAELPEARPAGRLTGRVQLKDVCFAYGDGEPVLRNITLDVEPGETIALVGANGAGKTTLVMLLQRHYDVTRGRILVDGRDVRTLTLESLRSQIGAVYQDVHLFNDTAFANIAYGRPGATKTEVEAAARAAHAHDFIEALPNGYDTILGERGNRLSGGQRQRIAIARALLVDPPILVLDEATSALDAESEHLVQRALHTLVHGRTTFIVAHRLSTVVDADRIVVLREGRIEAVGPHEDLLRKSTYYARLVRHQVDGFLPEMLDERMTEAA